MSDMVREDGYVFIGISALAVSTVVTSFPLNGTFHLHNAGSGTIYMGENTTIGAATSSWDIEAGEKMGPIHLTTETYFLASALQSLKYMQYAY